MFHCEFKEGEIIFKEEDEAHSFFVLSIFGVVCVCVILIAHGTVEVYVKETLTKTLKPGEGFGEMALLYNAPRSAEIRCVNQCKLWGVDRITFRKALEEMITRNFEENRRFIENISFFGIPTSL